MQCVLCLCTPGLERKQALLLFSLFIYAFRNFCDWVYPVYWSVYTELYGLCFALCWKQNRPYHCFLNQSVHARPFRSECAPCLNENRLYCCVIDRLCMQDLLCLRPVMERKEALSLFSQSVCSCSTFCFWVCRGLKKDLFVSGYAVCWKENRLSHCFLDRSEHAVPFVPGFAWVGRKTGFIIVFLVGLCMQCIFCLCRPGLEKKRALTLFTLFIYACSTFL